YRPARRLEIARLRDRGADGVRRSLRRRPREIELAHERAAHDDVADRARLRVVEQDEVRAPARRDRADALAAARRTREPIVTRDRPRRRAIRDLGRDTLRDRAANE